MLKQILLVAIGGASGSVLRFLAGLTVKTSDWPFSTFAVNVIGSFLLGGLIALNIRNDDAATKNLMLFASTGFCGGFTTFSAFTAENLRLMQESKWQLAFLYISMSLIFGILAAFFGFRLTENYL